MQDAVAWLEHNAASGGHEGRQLALHKQIRIVRIGDGVAERLQYEVSREAETGKVLELAARERAGGVGRA